MDPTIQVSIVRLADGKAQPEIIHGRPAEGVHFLPSNPGVVIRNQTEDLYIFSPTGPYFELIPKSLNLPPVAVTAAGVRVGSTMFSSFTLACEVGIEVTEKGFRLCGRIPADYRQYFVV